MRLGRRHLLALLAAASSGLAVGCTPDAASPEVEALAARLREAVAAVPRVTAAETRVDIPRRSPDRSVVATATLEPDLAAADLAATAEEVRSVLAGHPITGYAIVGMLHLALDGRQVTWDLAASDPGMPAAAAAAGAHAEIQLGADSAHLVDRYGINSEWNSDGSAPPGDSALLAPTQAGVPRTMRSVHGFGTGGTADVAVWDQRDLPNLPAAALIGIAAPVVFGLLLTLRDGGVAWQLSVASSRDGVEEAVATFLRRLRDSRVDGGHAVDLAGDWGAQVQVTDTVTVTGWRNEASRNKWAAVVERVVAAAND